VRVKTTESSIQSVLIIGEIFTIEDRFKLGKVDSSVICEEILSIVNNVNFSAVVNNCRPLKNEIEPIMGILLTVAIWELFRSSQVEEEEDLVVPSLETQMVSNIVRRVNSLNSKKGSIGESSLIVLSLENSVVNGGESKVPVENVSNIVHSF